MTTLQLIIKKAKALRKAAPKKYAKWTDYVKAASATIKPKKKATVSGIKKKAAPKKVVKKAAPKKVVRKKATSIHKDSKSHNVRINVVSGVEKDIKRSIDNFKRLETEIKEAQKNYDKQNEFTSRFYAKQKLDKLKYELRERKFVLTNLQKELKKNIK
jgi:hypothetical protein